MQRLYIAMTVIALAAPPLVAAADNSGADRLRFKTGPVCMCSTGLSEAEIRDAEKARRRSEGTASAPVKPTNNEATLPGDEEER